eukprot:685142-Rhodomonas_salina.2
MVASPLTEIGFLSFRVRYVSGTDIGYAATIRSAVSAMPFSEATLTLLAAIQSRSFSLWAVTWIRWSAPLLAYALAMRSPVLTQRMVLPEQLAPCPPYACERVPYRPYDGPGSSLRAGYAISGTDVAYDATSPAFLVLTQRMVLPAPSCYAMSGTEIAYGATRHPHGVLQRICGDLLSAYARATL